MKTQYEKQYENLIISLIVERIESKEEQVSSLIEFHENSTQYYEELCDLLYMLAVGRTDQYLWVSSSGRPQISRCSNGSNGFLICAPSSVPKFDSDLVEQLEFAFARLQKVIYAGCPNQKLATVSTLC